MKHLELNEISESNGDEKLFYVENNGRVNLNSKGKTRKQSIDNLFQTLRYSTDKSHTQNSLYNLKQAYNINNFPNYIKC